MRTALCALWAAAGLAATGLVPSAIAGASSTADGEGVHAIRSCSTLAAVTWPDGSRALSATDVPANGSTPEFCNVTLLVPDRINIVVQLPVENWNGRYEAVGGGGYDGVPYAGSGGQPSLAPVSQGYVVSTTDTGHQGDFLTSEWAWSPTGLNYNLIQDFAYRANHEMAVKTKDLIGLYYGSDPRYSYWNGCSTGGREGLTEAMRYPDDFDGIFAGSPAINWTHFIPAEEWPALVMSWMGDYLPACKEDAVTNAVIAACNGTADGAKDGLIDPAACRFDPHKLLGLKTPCGAITAADVAVIEKIWQGPRDGQGRSLWYGLEPGASFREYEGLPLGLAATASVPDASDPSGVALTATPFPISDDWLRYFIHDDPTWSYHEETYEQYVKDFAASVTEWAADLSTDDPNLAAFKRHGGKIIIWHGLADPLIFPQGTLAYYNRMLTTMGGLSQVGSFARLFLSANASHCAAGTGTFPDDPFAAVVKWREQNVAPAVLPSSGTNVAGQAITRNLCPYPQQLAYNGSGSLLTASSFHCLGALLPGSSGSDAHLGAPAPVISVRSLQPCASRRHFRIRLGIRHHVHLVSARVYVNGHRVIVLRGRRLRAPVDLRGLPKGRFTVRIVGRTRTGRQFAATRSYRTCTPRRGSRHT